MAIFDTVEAAASWIEYKKADYRLDAMEDRSRRSLAAGTFRGFGKLHRLEVKTYGEETKIVWRTHRGIDHSNQDTG